MLIQVFHNSRRDEVGRCTAMMDGYRAGDPLTHVFDFDLTDADAAGSNWPERVYELLNIGDDPSFGTPDDRAVAYRARRNRSLSVGDVLIVDGAAQAVAHYSFESVRVDPAQLVNALHHGTTPITWPVARQLDGADDARCEAWARDWFAPDNA